MIVAVTSGRFSNSRKSVVKKSASISSFSLPTDIGLQIAETDPADARIGAGDLRPDPADGAAADDGEPDVLTFGFGQGAFPYSLFSSEGLVFGAGRAQSAKDPLDHDEQHEDHQGGADPL